MANINTNFENNDFDTFLNLDHEFTPVSASPAIPSLAHQSSAASSSTLASSQPSFSGPSYQYDSHRQQTGLPMGGLANTFAVNQASGLHYRPNNMGFVMPTETLNLPLSNLDEFDFGRSQYDMNDMDFDADSPSDIPNMMYPSGSSHIKSESSQSTPIQRIYPGMHSQQAAQAKQRQEMLRQQQQQQQQKQIPGQMPLPTQMPKSAKDPHVEESISRLLSRMRQSSTSSIDENNASQNTSMSNIPKPKKDEEDMDEDERLLASEEGKKLSSKERRQLRNKVSARAFRSRRKEYIGQLESEIAAKAQEANDLRVQNRQLMEENTRLTDLTRMLLSSQAFSGFLQELSNSGMSLPSLPSTQSTQQAQPQRQSRKDVSAHEASRQLQSQNHQHVGMTLIPETNLEVSDFSSGWNMTTLPSNDFQVFSVTSLPQPPALDITALCEKKEIVREPFSVAKKEAPELSSLPPPVEVTSVIESEIQADAKVIDEDSTDLYATVPRTKQTTGSVESLLKSLRKPDTTTDVSTSVSQSYSDVSSELEAMCDLVDECCARLENFLP